MELGYHSHLSQGAPIAARTPDPGGAEALRRGAAAAMPAQTAATFGRSPNSVLFGGSLEASNEFVPPLHTFGFLIGRPLGAGYAASIALAAAPLASSVVGRAAGRWSVRLLRPDFEGRPRTSRCARSLPRALARLTSRRSPPRDTQVCGAPATPPRVPACTPAFEVSTRPRSSAYSSSVLRPPVLFLF